MKRILLITALLFIANVTAYAAPSFNGSTGLINIPTADVLRTGQYSVGYSNLKSEGIYIATLGFTPRLELGVTRRGNDYGNKKYILNAKYALIPEQIITPGLSIGIEDAAAHNKRTFYAAASKSLPFGLRMHLGVGNGRIAGLYYALEKTIAPIGIMHTGMKIPITTLILEYDGKNTNYGTRIRFPKGISGDFAWRNKTFYFGVSLTK